MSSIASKLLVGLFYVFFIAVIVQGEDEEYKIVQREFDPSFVYSIKKTHSMIADEEHRRLSSSNHNVEQDVIFDKTTQENVKDTQTSRFLYDEETDIRERIERYPAERNPQPFSKYNKILGMVCMYNFDHIDPFQLMLLPEYVSMCEGGWDPSVIIFTTVDWTPLVRRMFRDRSYCYRTGRNIDVRWAVFDPSISIALAAEHRKYMKRHVNDYDLFLYHEDDTPFKYHHVTAFTQEIILLKERFPWTGLYQYTLGFQRYRHQSHNSKEKENWTEQDIIEQQLLEESPRLITECILGEDEAINVFDHPKLNDFDWNNAKYKWPGGGTTNNDTTYNNHKIRRQLNNDDDKSIEQHRGQYLNSDKLDHKTKNNQRVLYSGDWDELMVYPYIHVTGNIHQGSYMMTQEQLKIADIKCDFLSHESPSREYMSSFSLFDTGPGHCGFKKLIPPERFQSFLIHHTYHQKMVGWFTTAITNDKTRTGRHYQMPFNHTDNECWNPIIHKINELLHSEQDYQANGTFPWDVRREEDYEVYTP